MAQQGRSMGPFCQSCGMPMTKPEEFGTSAGGWRQNDYCIHCYKDGEFTWPDATLEQMTDICVKYMVEGAGIGEAEARALMGQTLPHMKRWSGVS